MRILHITRQFYPLIGGMENYVLNLAEQQIKNGHSVDVLTLNRSFIDDEKLSRYEKLDNGVEVFRIPFFLSKKYTIALKTYRYLKKQYDVVNVHGVNFFSDFVALTKIFHRKKIILTTHGGFFHTHWGHFLKLIFFHTITRLTLKPYNAVIGCSDNDIVVFQKIYPKIIKVDNGVNVKDLMAIQKKPERNTLLYVGRIDVHKRIDNLIRLIPELDKKGFNARLLVVGPDWKGLTPELTKQIDELQLNNRITLTGPVSEKDLARYYSESFLFISASEYEGFGISAIEALASGTPCILNRIQSFQTILHNKPYGILCDFTDITKTADAIASFANDVKRNYSELSQKAREKAKEYNWESVAGRITKIYEQ